MEAAHHGVPVVAMPVYGDQLANGKRLEAAGVGINMDRKNFTAEELSTNIQTLVHDKQGSFARNVLRLQRAARQTVGENTLLRIELKKSCTMRNFHPVTEPVKMWLVGRCICRPVTAACRGLKQTTLIFILYA